MMKRMATRTTTIITDDLDGTELHPGQGETLTSALDGRTHEIDLTDEHAAALRAVLNPYVTAGRKGRVKPSRRRSRG